MRQCRKVVWDIHLYSVNFVKHPELAMPQTQSGHSMHADLHSILPTMTSLQLCIKNVIKTTIHNTFRHCCVCFDACQLENFSRNSHIEFVSFLSLFSNTTGVSFYFLFLLFSSKSSMEFCQKDFRCQFVVPTITGHGTEKVLLMKFEILVLVHSELPVNTGTNNKERQTYM